MRTIQALFWVLAWGIAACSSPTAAPATDATADAAADSADAVELPQAVTNPIAYVDPRFGSGGYAFAFGSAFPGATAPNGMMRVGPDTSGPYGTIGFLHFDGYWAGDDTILAFSHMHLHGTGSQDFGTLGIMPTAQFDPSKLHASDYAATFKKANEITEPGRYEVTLDSGIRARFDASTHVAYEKFFFPPGSTHTLVIDLSHSLSSVQDSSLTADAASRRLSGFIRTSGGMSGGYTLYFVIASIDGWDKRTLWTNGAPLPDAQTVATGKDVGVALHLFDSPYSVQVEVGTSLVSIDDAQANLDAELVDVDMPADVPDRPPGAIAAWNARLSTLTVYGGTDDQRKLFYSSLHHLFVMPGEYSDSDGSYTYAGTTQKANGFKFLTDISGWDVYRTAMPLYALVAPDLALNIVQSMHAMAKITGNFPKWPLAASDAGSMIGAAADVMIADAYLKGINGFDSADVYKRLRDAALLAQLPAGEGRGGRDDFADYAANGFVHVGHGAAVSLTCELNQDDFALANFATALGMADDATVLMARSHGYQKLFARAGGRRHDHQSQLQA